ncbi:c-type cytochrome biogenesis protein CcsB [Dietzia sp. Alg238-R159]|uniref:c-type cytochrome biogenesis protein CcsB n=1 Tax=Dietzia sp. Alg238-R159 TaxID=2305986 RepID=UPI0013CFC0B3|nr:c-type cytochrome biogenesis protein CcsB [Dietzia sp. Alg238-R159]
MITATLAQGAMGLSVDEALSNYSDLAYRTGFGLYALALLAAVIYYAGFRVAKTAPRQLAGAGGPGLVESTSITDTGDEEAFSARGTGWARVTLIFVGLAFVFHVASLVLRAVAIGRFPWGNMYEFISVTCALGIAAALFFLRKPAFRVAWPFVLVPVLLLLFFGGTYLYSVAAPVVPALQSFWFPIHVSIISLGSAIFLVSGVASVLHLIRVWQPQGKEKGISAGLARPLPHADTLDRLAYRTAVIAFPIFSVGVILGAVWAESTWGRFWGWDPKETASFVSWVLYAVYLHARATSGWGPKRASWINIAGFLVLLFNLFFINIVISGLHSYAGLN